MPNPPSCCPNCSFPACDCWFNSRLSGAARQSPRPGIDRSALLRAQVVSLEHVIESLEECSKERPDVEEYLLVIANLLGTVAAKLRIVLRLDGPETGDQGQVPYGLGPSAVAEMDALLLSLQQLSKRLP